MKIIKNQCLFVVGYLLDLVQSGDLSCIHLAEPILRTQANVEFLERPSSIQLPLGESWTMQVTLINQTL